MYAFLNQNKSIYQPKYNGQQCQTCQKLKLTNLFTIKCHDLDLLGRAVIYMHDKSSNHVCPLC